MSKLAAFAATALRDGDLPIPTDAVQNRYWTDAMCEMAAHIGPVATLQIVDVFGGLELYIPVNPERCAAYTVIGADKCAILCAIYTSERLPIPVGASAVRYAKIAPILAGVRARQISLTDAVVILKAAGIKTSRSYLSGIINKTDQGKFAKIWQPVRIPDARQMVMFDEDAA